MTKKMVATHIITPQHIEKGISYQAYRQLIDELIAEGKTTGDNHSEAYLKYTEMNVRRMKRLDKTTTITPDLQHVISKIETPQVWLVLTEAWCGDAAQNLPIIAKIAALNPKISLKLILRDENLEVMDEYLTNGGRSIPKVIFMTEDLKEFGNWGPRPQKVQEMVVKFKEQGMDYEKSSEEVHRWYAQNKGQELQNELLEILKS